MFAVRWLGSRRRLLVWTLVALGGLGFAGSASAATLTVTTTADSNDGSCTASRCSLRDAVVAADQAGGVSTIAVPAGHYRLTIKPGSASGCSGLATACDANDPTHGDLDIDNSASVTIAGAGPGSTVINANSIDRAFAVQQGSSLALSKLKIENGEAGEYSTAREAGGAIYSDGALKVTDSILDQNIANRGGDIFAEDNASSTSVTNSVLSNSFAGASGSYGGAIYLGGGTLTIDGVAFDTDQSYDYGGALYLDSGQPTSITSTSFLNGNAGYGGAIDDDNGALTISRSTFTNNSASDDNGGALYLDPTDGDVKITRSTFSGNSTLGSDTAGGAIYLDPGSTVKTRIVHSVFSGNEGSEYGGAIYYNDGYSLSISRSWLTANNAQYGGGIYTDSSAGKLTVDHSTLDHNSAAYESGGGLDLNNSSATSISNTTISYNQAGYGGGIDFETVVPGNFREPLLINDTIAHNEAGTHGTCPPAPGDCGGGIYAPSNAGGSIMNTIVADNAGGDCNAAAGTADDGFNLDSDGSCFPTSGGTPEAQGDMTANPRLGPLQDNGGPAPTEVPGAGSPAIGNSNGCLPTDERGVRRLQTSGQCDIGAVEVAAAPLTLAKRAPRQATQGNAFTYRIRMSDAKGPGPSTGTVLVDRLPQGETLYAVTPSHGTCSASGRPTKVVCDLGTLNSPHTGSNTTATVTLLVSEAKTGQVVNRARVHNDQGSSASASAPTIVAAAATGQAPKALTGQAGQLGEHSARLHGQVKPGGQPTSYFFQFRRPGSSTWKASAISHTGSNPEPVSARISGLRAGATYQFRLVATNDNGTSSGATHTFHTTAPAKRKPAHSPRAQGGRS
jgi:CSLREA domain-containing protein